MFLSLTSFVHPTSYVVANQTQPRNSCHCPNKTRNDDSLEQKIKEQEELLEHYEIKGYIYGRQAQDLQGHTRAKIRELKKQLKEEQNVE